MATVDAIDRQFTNVFNAAVELREQEQFDECTEVLRKMLADHAIPRYHRMRCLTMLACTLEDWHEAYTCYVKGETIWRITKHWHRNGTNPTVNRALDELHETLEEVKQGLLEDDIRPEDTPVPDVEADVLRAIAVYTAGVWQDYEIAEAGGEEESEEEISDEEEVDDEDEVGDKGPKVKVEQKASEKEESDAQKASKKETAVPDQKPKDEMVCLKAAATEGVMLTSRRCYRTVRRTYADPIWEETGKSCQRSPGGHLLDQAPRFESTMDTDQNGLDNPAPLSASGVSIRTYILFKISL
ncbi:hypothetical protein J4E93_002203 [Alternaria ventricosa]|uniref:uncharacterized protein n=1 Tax=Alternaria ventricosa TaxID=1187951 RepID=UPI0020C1E63F|nr:uncharacterized protein J4E93_002203 [Alternaria ventricosa]KAI4652006.1 hypothetical protein J4E93_002203 [Alternaria ventricosa]